MKGQISNFSQIASIRRSVITDGVSQGLKIIDCDNGKIRFILNESKALDIMQLYHEGQNVSFISRNGFMAQNLPFPQRFEGGMLYTCGLDSVGGRDGFETHGSFHLQPAEVIRAECTENGIVIEAYIKSSLISQSSLRVHRKITCAIGAETLTVEDRLENLGYGDENYCLLYHVNVGYPLLDDGAKIVGEVVSVQPRTPLATERINDRAVMGAPVPLDDEVCYFLKFKEPKVSIENEKLGKKFTLCYSKDTLPEFVEWKNLHSGCYVIGLEPATTVLDDGFKYKTIKAGESIDFKLELSVSKI